ncbi:MAG: FAD-dependent oxidoreductase [Proteobacteria bacterium]|jgi:fumarate reductase flavoprotein subunit|nr:FAD-dependent oxidoreductase [Pseudomonadota bacterium]
MPELLQQSDFHPDFHCDCLVIGGGAAGLTSALAANHRQRSVIVMERDGQLSGSTALSSGFIPAAETQSQKSQGISDSLDQFCDDIANKNHHSVDPDYIRLCAQAAQCGLDWLSKHHNIPFIVLDDFLYPGHSAHRMHTVPERTGAALIHRLEKAAQSQDITIVQNAKATHLTIDESRNVIGARFERPDGSVEDIASQSVILACNGYGGNPELISKYIPEMQHALYFGHPGNQGDAILWGQALGAGLRHLSGYQGHGSVAHPHSILITWALMMEGAIQVNCHGQRFSNEHLGYSEQAVLVLEQPQQKAWNIFDSRLFEMGKKFDDFRNAASMDAFVQADTLDDLANKLGINGEGLTKTFDDISLWMTDPDQKDPFGRNFTKDKQLSPPYYAVLVTGALFHTQGGLLINNYAKVMKDDGTLINGLYACGGAASGVSGPDVSGYLSGNGLLTAIGLGFLAGSHA